MASFRSRDPCSSLFQTTSPYKKARERGREGERGVCVCIYRQVESGKRGGGGKREREGETRLMTLMKHRVAPPTMLVRRSAHETSFSPALAPSHSRLRAEMTPPIRYHQQLLSPPPHEPGYFTRASPLTKALALFPYEDSPWLAFTRWVRLWSFDAHRGGFDAGLKSSRSIL